MTTFTHEATTTIRFPSDYLFSQFKRAIEERYHPAMVQVVRGAVYADGRTSAIVKHSQGLGAELRGIAYSDYEGQTLEV